MARSLFGGDPQLMLTDGCLGLSPGESRGRTSLLRDKIATFVGLAALIAAAWAYLLLGAGIGMARMDMGNGHAATVMPEWTPAHAVLVLVMWAVMMAAMMLPGAVPVITHVIELAPRPAKYAVPPAVFFVLGYLCVWAAFCIPATSLQWMLDSRDLLSTKMAIRQPSSAALLIIAVGLYQMTSLKHNCLRRCRSSTACLTQREYESASALAQHGLRYGLSCLGCSATLMGLLFVVGVMNPLGVGLISICVLAEKALPWGNAFARSTGIGLVAYGCVLLALAAR